MKRILVTGAAGFIGFHLCKALLEKGCHVVGIDNFNHYYDPKLKEDRIQLLDMQVLRNDICDNGALIQLLKEEEITHVMHLAAQAGVRHSLKHPKDYVASNLDGFVSIMEACRHIPNIKVIFASSSSVYGNNEKIPFQENDKTDQPTNLYGATKKANELIAYSYHHLFNIPMIGLRYFTVYGPWGRPDMAYYSFTKCILEKRSIPIFNNGLMQRDFTYIDDIIQGTISALDYPAKFEIFNLGNNQPIDLMNFIAVLEKLLGKRAIKDMRPHQKTEVPITFADITKSQKLLNFHPSTKLEDGLMKFIQWYHEYHSIASYLTL